MGNARILQLYQIPPPGKLSFWDVLRGMRVLGFARGLWPSEILIPEVVQVSYPTVVVK